MSAAQGGSGQGAPAGGPDVFYNITQLRQLTADAAKKGGKFNVIMLPETGQPAARRGINENSEWNTEYIRQATVRAITEKREFAVEELTKPPHDGSGPPSTKQFVRREDAYANDPNLSPEARAMLNSGKTTFKVDRLPNDKFLAYPPKESKENFYARTLTAEQAKVLQGHVRTEANIPVTEKPQPNTLAQKNETPHCKICLSVPYNDDPMLKPNLYCKTCQQIFHRLCLQTWLKMLPVARCPMCQQ